jgi:hypothetical protein
VDSDIHPFFYYQTLTIHDPGFSLWQTKNSTVLHFSGDSAISIVCNGGFPGQHSCLKGFRKTRHQSVEGEAQDGVWQRGYTGRRQEQPDGF